MPVLPCRLLLDNNYLWEWEGSLVVDYDYVEADHDVKGKGRDEP